MLPGQFSPCFLPFGVGGLVCFVAPAGAWYCRAAASAAGERLLD